MRINISNSELEVLCMMWSIGAPLHRGGILENSKDKTWKDSYIHILLNKMLEKGLIKEAGFTRSGKVWARLYAPVITPEECIAKQFEGLPPVWMARALRLCVENTDLDYGDIIGIKNALDMAYGGQGVGWEVWGPHGWGISTSLPAAHNRPVAGIATTASAR